MHASISHNRDQPEVQLYVGTFEGTSQDGVKMAYWWRILDLRIEKKWGQVSRESDFWLISILHWMHWESLKKKPFEGRGEGLVAALGTSGIVLLWPLLVTFSNTLVWFGISPVLRVLKHRMHVCLFWNLMCFKYLFCSGLGRRIHPWWNNMWHYLCPFSSAF